MTMNRREFNKQETVRHIRRVFMQLYAKAGMDGVSVNTLCKECGIAKSTFYLYFDDKYAVLDSVERELLDGLWSINTVLNRCSMEDVQAGRPLPEAYRTVRYINEHAKELKALLGRNGDPRFVFKWKKDIERSFLGRFEREQGSIRSAGIACTIFSSALVGLYTNFLLDMSDVTEHEFSIILGNLLKYSLFDFHAFAE